MVSKPSPSPPVTVGDDSASAGCDRPFNSPGTRPWVANARILNPERSIVLTACSLACLPRLRTFDGSACNASAIDFSSSAVSGSRGNIASRRCRRHRASGCCGASTARRASVLPPASASLMLASPLGSASACLFLAEIGIAERDQFAAVRLAGRQLAQRAQRRRRRHRRDRVGPRQPRHLPVAWQTADRRRCRSRRARSATATAATGRARRWSPRSGSWPASSRSRPAAAAASRARRRA